jgi:predicted esterase
MNKKCTIIQPPYWTFNFPDVADDDSIIIEKVNLGQDDDIATLAYNYTQFIQTMEAQGSPLDEIVIIGLSRGASTIINFVATHHPPLLKALVLESPFDTIENVILYQMERRHIAWIPCLYSIIFYYYKRTCFPAYNTQGIKPLNVITNLPVDLPILFVHSQEDELISPESSQRLLQLLRSSGHKNCYLLKLKWGEHGRYQLGEDATLYEAGVHAFFHKFGIPCLRKPSLTLEEIILQ